MPASCSRADLDTMVKRSSQRNFAYIFIVISTLLSSHLSLAFPVNAVSEALGSEVDCHKLCGVIPVTYPFYLKSCGKPNTNSEFGLECINNSTLMITFNEVSYAVTSIYSDSIVINPNKSACSIELDKFTIDGVRSYAISTSNIIQLNCTNKPDNSTCPLACNIPSRGNDEQCTFKNTCCHFLDTDRFWNRRDTNFTQFSQNCTGFTSWVLQTIVPTYHAENGLKLEWAIPGNCSTVGCDANANCLEAQNVEGAVKCACKDGYIGDGFVEGIGCTRDCKTSGKHCEKDKTTIIILAVGLLSGSALIAAGMVSIALLNRQRRCKQLRRGGDGNQLASLLHSRSQELSTEVFSYKILNRATKGFADAQTCGQGACGTVYVGRLPDGGMVAVKRMHHSASKEGAHQFVNEISLLSTIKHKNLVQLLGFCLEADDPILVYEFVPNGTLTEHLHCEQGKGPLDWRTRCTIAADSAQALAHLHTNLHQPVYHRDVKSPNILIDLDFNCKVADFGLSRLAPLDFGTHISTAPQGTPGYLDPEYHENFHLSDKSDVYSFGVVLVEIITAMKPVDFTRNKKEINLAALAVAKITSGCLDDIVDPRLGIGSRPRVRALVHRVAELAFRCLAHDKDARPTMTEVAEELLAVKNECVNIEDMPLAIASESPEKSALSPTSVQALWPSNSTAHSDSS